MELGHRIIIRDALIGLGQVRFTRDVDEAQAIPLVEERQHSLVGQADSACTVKQHTHQARLIAFTTRRRHEARRRSAAARGNIQPLARHHADC